MEKRRWAKDVEECGRLVVRCSREDLIVVKGIIIAKLFKKPSECERPSTARRWEFVIAEPRVIGG